MSRLWTFDVVVEYCNQNKLFFRMRNSVNGNMFASLCSKMGLSRKSPQVNESVIYSKISMKTETMDAYGTPTSILFDKGQNLRVICNPVKRSYKGVNKWDLHVIKVYAL